MALLSRIFVTTQAISGLFINSKQAYILSVLLPSPCHVPVL
ncbi:hypothetical protein FB99_41660 (plasmid) [Pantoea agglomerans]|nr:hypothetical protein FB99_41660 [Pantoea agglomerans]